MTASPRAPSRSSAPRSDSPMIRRTICSILSRYATQFRHHALLSVADSDVDFAVMRLSDSFYVPLEKEHHVVLATWARIGTISAATARPSCRRPSASMAAAQGRYARMATRSSARSAPTATRPADGRSSSSVPSCAGACSGTSAAPCSSRAATSTTIRCPISIREIRWGAGVGLRYFTEFGPVRLDVAFPINPRRSDDVFQVYIGIGQAF